MSSVTEPTDPTDLHDAIGQILAKTLFFIGGSPKSGTTWLQLMLDAHPAVRCRGEGHLMNRLGPALQQSLNDHNRYLDGKRAHLAEGQSAFPPFATADLGYLMTAAIALSLRRFGNGPGVRAIGEKTPDNVEHFHQFAALLPNARFLHIVRDGRDCAVSSWFHNLRADAARTRAAFPTIGAFTRDVVKTWRKLVEAGLGFNRLHPDRCLTVRYEDLATRPEAILRAILSFLGVDAGPAVIAACIAAGRFETLSGGRAPGEEDPSSFFRQGTPGNWRTHMTASDADAYWAAAGDLLTHLGYAR